MTKTIRFATLSLALASLAALAGCSGSDGLGKHYQITGTVNYNGQPLKKGTISFAPEAADGHVATGEIDNGQIKNVGSLAPGDGILGGKYKVAIAAQEAVDVSGVTKKYKAAPDQVEVANAQSNAKKLIPDKYMNAMDSGLTADVSSSSTNFKFDLKD